MYLYCALVLCNSFQIYENCTPGAPMYVCWCNSNRVYNYCTHEKIHGTILPDDKLLFFNYSYLLLSLFKESIGVFISLSTRW